MTEKNTQLDAGLASDLNRELGMICDKTNEVIICGLLVQKNGLKNSKQK